MTIKRPLKLLTGDHRTNRPIWIEHEEVTDATRRYADGTVDAFLVFDGTTRLPMQLSLEAALGHWPSDMALSSVVVFTQSTAAPVTAIEGTTRLPMEIECDVASLQEWPEGVSLPDAPIECTWVKERFYDPARVDVAVSGLPAAPVPAVDAQGSVPAAAQDEKPVEVGGGDACTWGFDEKLVEVAEPEQLPVQLVSPGGANAVGAAKRYPKKKKHDT